MIATMTLPTQEKKEETFPAIYAYNSTNDPNHINFVVLCENPTKRTIIWVNPDMRLYRFVGEQMETPTSDISKHSSWRKLSDVIIRFKS